MQRAYNFLKRCSIFLIARKTINKKFVISIFLHCSLEKLNGHLRGNNLSFFNHVLNHGAVKHEKQKQHYIVSNIQIQVRRPRRIFQK